MELTKLPALGKRPIAHLDLRFRGRQTLERIDIRTMDDVMNADPSHIVRRSLYFTSTDTCPFAEAEVRSVLKRPNLPHALDVYIHRMHLNFAQRVKERLRLDMPLDPGLRCSSCLLFL